MNVNRGRGLAHALYTAAAVMVFLVAIALTVRIVVLMAYEDELAPGVGLVIAPAVPPRPDWIRADTCKIKKVLTCAFQGSGVVCRVAYTNGMHDTLTAPVARGDWYNCCMNPEYPTLGYARRCYPLTE